MTAKFNLKPNLLIFVGFHCLLNQTKGIVPHCFLSQSEFLLLCEEVERYLSDDLK